MEQAIVFAAQQFIGFELCKQLLNEGFEVIALEHEMMLDEQADDKWLEIGRNANLTYEMINNSLQLNHPSYICFIPLYDLFIQRNNEIVEDWHKRFTTLYQMIEPRVELIIFISPVQWRVNENTIYQEIRNELLQSTRKSHWIEFFLPTIYGPWQPNQFLFQLLINEQQHQNYIDDLEDAVYIEDAVRTILDNTDMELYGEKVLIESGHRDMWWKCVNYLNPTFQRKNQQESQKVAKFSKKISVKENMSYEQALEKQKQHYFRK